ncbi:MAG: GNAT family N-acetyltransferase, partial [Victivallales bacterium]|nr:GNAT family N-acetyltransferase [Victivallales bacterium]
MGRQLQMVWTESESDISDITLTSDYELRAFRNGDEAGHVAVLREAGFSSWDEKQIETWRSLHALPDGIFVIASKVDDKIVATAMATHRTTEPHPSGGELGWVAASGDHAGKGLGRAVCIAVLNRYVDAGYKHIYLNTDDHRLAAIKIYLKLGFKPFIFASDMEERWKIVCDNLKWPFDVKSSPRATKKFWIQEPEEDERKDQDDLNRYAKRCKWLPNREHRGFS